jgi:hypothetical protein
LFFCFIVITMATWAVGWRRYVQADDAHLRLCTG